MKTCRIEGCTRLSQLRSGLCGTHYSRLRRTGTTDDPPAPMTDEQRLLAGAPNRPSGACWIWTGPTNNHGYGRFGGSRYAHRVSYQLAHGPIPPGMVVLHRCDNPPCVNPDHLSLGTQRDNVRDMVTKGRHNPGGFRSRSAS